MNAEIGATHGSKGLNQRKMPFMPPFASKSVSNFELSAKAKIKKVALRKTKQTRNQELHLISRYRKIILFEKRLTLSNHH